MCKFYRQTLLLPIKAMWHFGLQLVCITFALRELFFSVWRRTKEHRQTCHFLYSNIYIDFPTQLPVMTFLCVDVNEWAKLSRSTWVFLKYVVADFRVHVCFSAPSCRRPSFATSKSFIIMLGVMLGFICTWNPQTGRDGEKSETRQQDERKFDHVQHKLCTRVSGDSACVSVCVWRSKLTWLIFLTAYFAAF